MSCARRACLGGLLATFALAGPWIAPARAHRPAMPRCPRQPVQEGTRCPSTSLSCTWRGTHEGGHDVDCTCVLGADDHLTWHCTSSGAVYRD